MTDLLLNVDPALVERFMSEVADTAVCIRIAIFAASLWVLMHYVFALIDEIRKDRKP